jgi:hypothetical protein
MKMQRIKHLCDICYLEDEVEETATRLAIQFGIGNNVMVADMCERHVDFLNVTLDLYFRAGRRPDAVIAPKITKKSTGHPSPTGDLHCPVTGCPRSFVSNQALSMHKTRVHQIPGIAKNGQAAHDAAVLTASANDVAPGTTPPVWDERMERKRAADRARKQRVRDLEKAKNDAQ